MKKYFPYLIAGVVAYLLFNSNKKSTSSPIPDTSKPLPQQLRGIRNVSV